MTRESLLLKDINRGSEGSNPRSLTNINDTLYFIANDGIKGEELWKSDGTAEGTVLVKDILPGANGSFGSFYYYGSTYNNFTEVNGTLYFTAYDDTNRKELWKSNGTAEGTVLVKDDVYVKDGVYYDGSSYVTQNLININDTLYFTANDDTNGEELWKSNGTSEGTVLVKDIDPNGSSAPENLTEVNGTLYFTAYDDTNGVELWKSDGTSEGTVLVKDIQPGNSSSSPNELTEVNGILYFTAYDDTNGKELWKSDGTSKGTVLVKDILLGDFGSNPRNLTNINGTLYFAAYDGFNGLLKSDGTAEGTVRIIDTIDLNYWNLAEINDTLYFAAFDEGNGVELRSVSATSPPTIAFKAATFTEEEGNDGVITLTRSGEDLTQASQVTISITGGTATSGDDFDNSGFPLEIEFAANETEKTFNIPLVKDTAEEGNETINIKVEANDNAELGTQNTATLNITDFVPPPTIAFKAATFTEEEGNDGVITLTRSGEDLTQASQVTISITGGTATSGDDFDNSGFPLEIEFAANETEKTFKIPLVKDTAEEGNETINIKVEAKDNAELGTQNTATLNITDKDLAGDGSKVYRFYNTNLGVHFYTASEKEKDSVLENLPQYRLEGASYTSIAKPDDDTDPLTGAKPVYRFYNENTGVHLYTISENEKNSIIENLSTIYRFEDIAYYAFDTAVDGAIPVYRFYNTNLDVHFYTPSAAEKDSVLDTLPQYRQEGIGGISFYVSPVDK